MFKYNKILAVLMAFVLLVCGLCACGEDYSEAYIYFELLDMPKTLDPQIASSDSELLIVRNIYEGLLRHDENGKIISGVSESYTYENLTYTFKLKKDLLWSDGTPLTAYDFEYGLHRAVDPKIKAPFASRLFAIANAEAINNGNADISTLGVKAIDETTLTITLCREDNDFLETLTTSVCMPCNKEFFENSIGKYGLDAECIISNGSYRLAKWNKEDFGIRIYKNEKYNGDFETKNAAVFISCVDDETQVSRIVDGNSDMAFVSCKELDSAKEAELETVSVQNICWFLTISRNYPPEVRRAFTTAFSNEVYSSAVPDGFTAAKSIYPNILNLNTDGIGVTNYNIDEAKSVMSAQISNMENSKFPSATLYYYENDGIKSLATAIVGHWQQNLSTFINIESSKNLSALQSEIAESTLDFALFPITVTSGSFSEYARNFSKVSTAATPDTLQQQLLDGNHILPVAYQNTNISYISSLENVICEENNGYIDFSFIVKK